MGGIAGVLACDMNNLARKSLSALIMKKTFLLFCFPSLAVCAQPVVQHANMAPVGSSFPVHVVTDAGNSNPALEGANVTWDFSSATLLMNMGTVSWMDPAATPQGAGYPASNLAQRIVLTSGTTYNYYDLQPAKLDQLADNVGGSTVSVFTDPKQLLAFPFNYQDSFEDTFAANGGATETYTRSYTGYGTVILPTGTYTNVMKMTSSSGTIDFLRTDPVMQLVHIETNGSMLVSGDPVIGVAEHAAAPVLRAWPNPATGTVSIAGMGTTGTWSLVDMEGRIQRQGIPAPATLELPLDGLAPGCYALLLREPAGFRSLRIVKQ